MDEKRHPFREWSRKNLYRVSLTQLLLASMSIGLILCFLMGLYVFTVYHDAASSIIWKIDLVQDLVQYSPVIFVSLISGLIGAKCRIYMDEMRIAKEPGFHQLSEEYQDKVLREYGFNRHMYLLGIVAAFVAIITLGEDLSVMHQCVLGLLSSMAGSQFLAQRLEGGSEESPNFGILKSKSDHMQELLRTPRPIPNSLEHVAATLQSGLEIAE